MDQPTTVTRRAELDPRAYVSALEALHQGVALIRIDRSAELLNSAATEILGYSGTELEELARSGRWISYREDGAEIPEVDRPIWRTLTTGEVVDGEVVAWPHAKGHRVVLRLSTQPVLDVEGRVVAAVVAFDDVTAERRAEAALADAEQQLRQSFDEAVIGMAFVGIDGRYLRVNDALARMLGLPVESILGRIATDFVPEDAHDLARDAMRRLLAGEAERVEQELRLVRPDDAVVWVRSVVSIVHHADGTPRHLVCQVDDVTATRAAAEAVRVVQARFAALVERSTDIICLIDGDGRLTYASPAGERLLGFAAGSQVERPFGELVHPDDLATVGEAFDQLRRDPGSTVAVSCRLGDNVGRWRYVEVVATNRLDDPDVQGVVANVRDVTERMDAAARVSWQAFHDSLTGLPNRALLLDRLGHALERGKRKQEQCALLFIDLDRFKSVNDTFGHAAGDQLLIEVAARLTHAVRADDTVARLGGDEFIVLAESLADSAEAVALAERVNEALRRPVVLAEGTVEISASIGIAFDTDHQPDSLFRDADNALYRAKARGKNRFEVFDDGLRAEATRRLGTEQMLRRALDDEDGLTVHYQPMVDLATGRIVATEALLRVRGADGRWESPAEFIPIAEESGIIVAMGAGVLEDACRRMREWRDELGDSSPRQVSVNVAARQLAAPGMVDLVERSLLRYDLVPADLTLEFTESVIIGAARSTTTTIERLHDIGVSLAVDDFGTGYSSLSYLKRFPVDAVKLDREFVAGLGTDPSDTEIVRAVISLGRSLGLLTIAEGIETAQQLEALGSLGCDWGQGFLLARPVPPEDLPALVRAGVTPAASSRR